MANFRDTYVAAGLKSKRLPYNWALLNVNYLASSTIIGSGSLVSNLKQSENIISSILGSGSLTGAVGQNISGVSTIVGSGSLAGLLGSNQGLVSSITGTGSLAGLLGSNQTLVATITGSGFLNGLLNQTAALNGSLVGSGSVEGTLANNQTLIATITGTGSLAGTISVAQALAVLIEGMGSLIGTLTSPDNDYLELLITNMAAKLVASGVFPNVGISSHNLPSLILSSGYYCVIKPLEDWVIQSQVSGIGLYGYGFVNHVSVLVYNQVALDQIYLDTVRLTDATIGLLTKVDSVYNTLQLYLPTNSTYGILSQIPIRVKSISQPYSVSEKSREWTVIEIVFECECSFIPPG